MFASFNKMGHRNNRAQPLAGGAMPAATEQLQDWLRSAGVKTATLYGSSLYAGQLGYPNRIDDHDIIVGQTDLRWWKLRERLARDAHFEYSTDHPLQPKRLFYTLPGGVKADVCLSYNPRSPAFMADNALFGVSAIAADLFTKKVWARPEFTQHAHDRVIRPIALDDLGLILKYADKMSMKFPDFAVDLSAVRRPQQQAQFANS